ncbi:MAG: hypothetical protein INH41_10105 [Myxococcaceae bacterium]|nr:hypothetical protein [Myxococcaceae bacterium]MCA3012735.1 hypothetical protein [Myxococcaceae bacterium]
MVISTHGLAGLAASPSMARRLWQASRVHALPLGVACAGRLLPTAAAP